MKKIDHLNFPLEEKLTQEQLDFFDENGAIIFRNFISPETVQLYISEIKRIEDQWLEEGRDKVNGVPLKFGKDENGKTMIQRMCFLSLFSDVFHDLLKDPRLKGLIEFLLPYDGRIAENEKD
ncbi:MAG TPA: phytanoyl-CoA dioxygenase, partial [Puia sp.]|nr:phytanoyl-CoA dioxygenase [Puia sp.]